MSTIEYFEPVDIFVSGRLCLVGEHRDWAGEYRQFNPQIQPGMAVVMVTNQGIYAHVQQHSQLICQTLHCPQVLESAMTEEPLLAMAQKNNFDCYVAGVAYQALIRYPVEGLFPDNCAMDLPLQKVCLLVLPFRS